MACSIKEGDIMIRGLVVSVLTCGCVLLGACCGWAQADPALGGGVDIGAAGTISNLGNLSNFGLNPGLVGGGESMPGAILVKIRGEVQCVGCTLEEMDLRELLVTSTSSAKTIPTWSSK